jgi:hypothetical protein
MRPSVARTPQRSSMPQIAITPVADGFAVRIDGEAVQLCADELDAHHWGKHAFEAVNQGLRGARPVAYAMQRLCLHATQYNLHR